jgi:hypothetical protein
MKKLILISILVCATINIDSQNITSTLGTDGTFSLKSGTTTFLSLGQSDSVLNVNYNLNLPNTTSSKTGILSLGGIRFLHDYGSYNTFLGNNTGNFTLSGYMNTGLGYNCFYSITSGSHNTAVGSGSLSFNTSGSGNTAIGNFALNSNTEGSQNTSIGYLSMGVNSTGNYNTALGYNSLFNNLTANGN